MERMSQEQNNGNGNGSPNNGNGHKSSRNGSAAKTRTDHNNSNNNNNNNNNSTSSETSAANSNKQHASHSSSNHETDEKGGLLGFIFGGKKDHTANNRQSSMASPQHIVKLPQVPDTMTMKSEAPSDRERIETEIIKSLIESYFNIVRKNFLDLVPKTIMYFLVNHCRDSVQNELVSELYKDDHIQDLMVSEVEWSGVKWNGNGTATIRNTTQLTQQQPLTPSAERNR